MSNRTKPGRRFGKGKTLFGNKGHGGDDGDDFDDGNGSDNDDGGDRSTTKKPVRRRDKTTGKTDANPGGSDEDLESGNDDGNDEGGRISKDPKLRRSGKVKRSDIDDINNEEAADSNDEDEGVSDNPEKAAEDIEKSFESVGLRPPSKLRFKKTKVSDGGDIIIDEPVDGEANAEFIGEVAEAMEEVDVKIQNLITKIKPGTQEARRNAIFLNDTAAITKFGEAAETVKQNGSVKAALAKAGMKMGGITVSVLAVIGGLAIVGVGSFLTIVSQAGGPAKIAAAISEQVIKGAQNVNDKVDRKLEKDDLKKDNAQQLMRLLGTNAEAVANEGTINPTSLATFSRFKLMAAANMRENAGDDEGEDEGEEA